MDTQIHSAGGLEQDEHVEKKPSYMNRVKAKARKIRDSIGSKMQNHDNETDEEDQFLDAPEKVPEVHGEPKQKSPEVKTGSNNLNSGTTPSNLAEHRDADTTREYRETGAPEPKRMDSEKPYTAPLETNSAVSTLLEADKENAGSTWMDFEKENAEQTTDHIGTDLTDADAKEADVEPMTRSFGGIDITGKPEPTGTDGHDKFSFDSITHPTATNEAKTQENTEDFYETKSDNMNVDEEPNVNPTCTENKPSAPSAIAAIAATAASTIAGTSISAKDTVSSKLGYNGNTVTTDAKAMDNGASIGEETKSSTPSVGDYEKFGGTGTRDVSKMTGTEKEGVGFVTDNNTGASVKDYLVEKISPGDEGKPLLEVFSEVMHKRKEEFPEKVAENMDKVTESSAVTKRLGTDERGYERDENESFGTDGGSLTGGSFGGAGMESPAVSKMGEQIKEHDARDMHKPKEEFPEKVAENVDKVTELPEVATRLGTDERGYEIDEGESFGTDGGSFGAAGMESPAVSKIGEQVKEHDARVMLEKVAENKVTESPEVAARLGTDEHGYEKDDDDSFGTAPVITGGGLESPTASGGMVDRAKGLVNYYWYGNEAAVKPDDDVHKVADGGAEEKQDESHETNTTGVVGKQ